MEKKQQHEYQEEIKTVKEFMQKNPDRFDSTEEVVSAIILLYNEIAMKTQYKIDKYKVDFYLPEHKIVYEVDGITHKNKVYFDNEWYTKREKNKKPKSVKIGDEKYFID